MSSFTTAAEVSLRTETRKERGVGRGSRSRSGAGRFRKRC